MNNRFQLTNEFNSAGLSDDKKHRRRRNLIVTIIVIVVFLTAELLRSNLYISVEKVTYLSNDLPSSFNGAKIVLLSDFHSNGFCENRILNAVEEQRPDYIFLAGDIVDESDKDLSAAKDFVERLSKIADTYIVFGNHDLSLSIDRQKELSESFKKSGAHLLDNGYTYLERGNSKILLVGTSDTPDSISGPTKLLLSELPRDQKCVFWIHHYPEDFSAILNESEKLRSTADLVFSGHAHGGLIGVPFAGGLYAPGQGFFPKYISGRYNEGNSSMLVSRGVGNSGMTKRLFNSLHMIVVELNSAG